MMPKISLYQNAWDKKGIAEIELSEFLHSIKDGKWQDDVLRIRTIRDVKTQKEQKKTVPMVTLAGAFSERADGKLAKHSNFIGIDVDEVSDLSELKSLIYPDPYIYAGFDSIRGYGLCLVFRIKGKRHREAFQGIAQYLLENYGIVVDPTSVNESRARFVSWDPHLYLNEEAQVFEKYPEKRKEKAEAHIIYAQNDFENIIREIGLRGIDLVPNYYEWHRIGFALADKFGEDGRQYYHAISSVGAKYNHALCDRQYTACIKAGKSGITIATLYYYAKQAGIETVSQETKRIAQTAEIKKKQRKPKEDVKEAIGTDDNADSIINQVYANDTNVLASDALIDRVRMFLSETYTMRRNLITRRIEIDGKPMYDTEFNDVWCEATTVLEKVTSEMLERVIHSSFTPNYNPLHDFFAKHKDRKPSGAIKELFSCIASPDLAYTEKLGTKWLVSIIAAIHGEHSPLMLVLVGAIQGTGKTEFMRRLLPDELRNYYAESKLDAGKDDEILMTQKLIIVDDEMGGKSKKDEKKLKEMLSRQTFSLREPYGKYNVDLNRLAVLGGTTNTEAILNDPTGNRRILPVQVYAINQDDYNKVDKVDVFMEAYHLYKNGYNWRMLKDEIGELSGHSEQFENYSIEYELILRWYRVPEKNEFFDELSATEVKVFLEQRSGQKLNVNFIGNELKRMGFAQKHVRINKSTKRIYCVIQKPHSV